MKMKSKVTAQPVSNARSASSGTPYTAGQESGGSTSEVVSVVGLDGTLSAPPVEDQESSQSSATRISIEGGNSVNNLMSDPYSGINDTGYWSLGYNASTDEASIPNTSYNFRGNGNLRGASNRVLFNPLTGDGEAEEGEGESPTVDGEYSVRFLGNGIYLTLNEGHAKTYARQKSVRTNAKEADRVVMPLYVRLENPYRETDRKTKQRIKEGGKAARDNYKNKLISEGHDGVLMVNPTTNEITEVVVFDPNAVKSVNNKGSWSREIDNIYEQQLQTFEQQGKQQEQGKLVPQAVFQIANIVENFDFAKSKPFATNRQFKLEIQNRVKNEAKKSGVDVSKFTSEVEKYLVQTLLADANYALIENPNAIGWYNEKVTKAVRLLSLVYPKLATDTRHGFIFKWALATTSNGIKVDKNFEYAADVYEKWLRSEEELGEGNGRLPELMLNKQGEPTGGESLSLIHI